MATHIGVEHVEMEDFSENRIADRETAETEIDLPDVPVDSGNVQSELIKVSFINEARKNLKITKNIDHSIYRGLTLDREGQILYNNKRITHKSGRALKLYSIKTLMRNPDSREFLRLIGYTDEETRVKTIRPERLDPIDRDEETVAPEQTVAMKSKIESFKATEDWAKKEKDKAERQLEQTADENER